MYLNMRSKIAKCRPKPQFIQKSLLIFLVTLSLASSALAQNLLRFRVNEDLGSLDWGYGEVTALVAEQLMEGLTSTDVHGQAKPALATRWSSSKDASQYVFHINPKANWSDGKRVCSSDFVDAWTRVKDPSFAAPYVHLFSEIDSFSSRGCNELIVTLRRPNRYFSSLVSHRVFFPIRKDLLTKYGNNWTRPENLVVTGPFVLVKWIPNKTFEMRKNPKYFGIKPVVDQLQALVISDDTTALNLFNSGELHWMKDLPFFERPKLSKKPEFHTFKTLIGYHLGFLMSGPNALSQPLRCALSKSINKNEIPHFLFGGEVPAWGVLPPALEQKRSSSNFNLVEAKKLLAQTSMPERLELHYYAKEIHEPLVQWLQQEWKDNLGIEVKLVRTEGKTYWSRLGQDPPPLFLSGITAAYAHPDSFLSEFRSDSKANWGHFKSSRYDNAEVNLAQQILLHDECAVIPLYFRSTAVLAAPQWEGITVNVLAQVSFKSAKKSRAKISHQ